MNDDQLDDMLIRGARDYNEPGAVPREEIWARIRAEREARGTASNAVGPGRRATGGRRVWVWTGLAAAAGLILAAGIGIGRRLERTPSAGSTAAQPELSPAYRLVMLQHLAGSEAMIMAFRSAARRGDVDSQLATWSRDLLSTTRMLEASPVSGDPSMKRLLDDLDLVIVQINQYVTRGTNDPDDLDLIEQSINKRGVITKLRSPLPARTAPTGT